MFSASRAPLVRGIVLAAIATILALVPVFATMTKAPAGGYLDKLEEEQGIPGLEGPEGLIETPDGYIPFGGLYWKSEEPSPRGAAAP